MIHTSITQNCMVFLKHRELTQSAILWSHNFDSTKWQTMFLCDVRGKPCNFEACLCADHYILLLNYLSNQMHFITNDFKCFSKTSSSDPR